MWSGFYPELWRMKIVVTAATAGEWKQIETAIHSRKKNFGDGFEVSFHQSGVGMLASAFSLYKLINNDKPDFVMQVGIAGCFTQSIALGEVVVVSYEYLGDMGVEEDGLFKDVFDLKLEDANAFPFEKKQLANPWLKDYNLLNLLHVTSLTVNEITVNKKRIDQLLEKYQCAIESMEGAVLHYIALQTNTPFIQIRAVSNYIGERDKSKWLLQPALQNLSENTVGLIDSLYSNFKTNKQETAS